MVYNNPVSYGVDITPEMFVDLADEPRLVAIKESSENVRRITDLTNVCGDRYLLFCGVDDLVLESLLLGAIGWVSGLVNAFPDENRLLWDLATAGRWDEALRSIAGTRRCCTSTRTSSWCSTSSWPQQECGLGSEMVRRPGCRWRARSASGSWRSSAGRSRRGRSCRRRPGRESGRDRSERRGETVHRIQVIDSHTGGEPTRVVIAGGPDLGGGSMAERLAVFREQSRHVPLGRRQRAARLGRDGRRPALRAGRSRVRGRASSSSTMSATWGCAATARSAWR